MGRQQGITEEKLQGLADYENAPAISWEERALLRYADALTSTPVDVPDEIFDGLRHFFDDAQIVEITSAFAWENYRARFDHALKIESAGFSEGAFCPVPVPGGVVANPADPGVD